VISADISIAPMQAKTAGTVMTFRDITERDELQRQLDQATRLNSLGTLAAKMAHEFNNVLMGIFPFVDMIRSRSENDPRIVKWCGAIAQSVARGKRVTQEVLRFTRPQMPNRRVLAVDTWLNDLAPALRATAGATIALDVVIYDRGLRISGDREQFEQLLINLISNSRDAMPGGGSVAITAARDGDSVRISVRDNGPGMAQETAKRVFEPFFTTKRVGGTGLGLSIADQIVKAHAGTIELHSAPGQGTAFEIRLPLTSLPVSASSSPAGDNAPFCGAVLVIEDDDAVAAGLRDVLEQTGAQVSVASTGKAALDVLCTSVPDAVVLDIGLPDIDGVALYTLIAARHPTLPVIFSTGHGDEAAVREFLRRPNVRFLLKPYPAETLVEALLEITRPEVLASAGLSV
jgi:nitrogen-specific signal transduction histidine kinase/ActR/RegA family two-component response regulator